MTTDKHTVNFLQPYISTTAVKTLLKTIWLLLGIF